nr:MAG TPA: hypothetical protein [Caudoviricetes sp.]
MQVRDILELHSFVNDACSYAEEDDAARRAEGEFWE